MEIPIRYTTDPPDDFGQLLTLYESLGWNSLNLSAYDLERMCLQSWHAVYAFDGPHLVGMGRVISDGVITGVICGLCVLPNYQFGGIGTEIIRRLVRHCERHQVIPQLMCTESLEPYYGKLGFQTFAVAMTRSVRR